MIQSIGQLLDNQQLLESEFPIRFKLSEAPQTLLALLRKVIPSAQWVKGYEGVAEWLSDNKGRGLLLSGGCGVGKTIIATKIVPCVVHSLCERICHIHKAREMSDPANVKAMTFYPLKVIDDVGTESETNDYGVKRYVFSDIVDVAEDNDHFLVATTNLPLSALRERYGERTFDRLRAICKIVVIEGESLRR